MFPLLIKSWAWLLFMEYVSRARGLSGIVGTVAAQDIRNSRGTVHRTAEEICYAVDMACVFYFKPVMCLQRSAVTTALLRRDGLAAEMVIGAQVLPFRSHAWVEIEHVVVNDKPYMLDIYKELQRC